MKGAVYHLPPGTRTMTRSACICAVVLGLWLPAGARAEEVPEQYRKAIAKGLDWLAKAQHRDGHWEATGGAYPVAMTGLSGIALVMEGSTIRDGKYHDNILRATDWLMSVSQRSGLISPLNNSG